MKFHNCHHPNAGDGICDDENNNEHCDDGGDCCLPETITDYCTECKCLQNDDSISRKNEISAKTYYYNYTKPHHEKGIWSEGPTMQYRRKKHAVGIVTDRMTLKKFVVVTGGVGVEGALKSTEILLEDSWTKGKISYHTGC